MVYIIQATVKRCGALRWDRTASLRLPFVPLDRPNFRSCLQTQTWRDCQIIQCGNLQRDTTAEVRDLELPQYSPAVYVEAGITSTEPLHPGDPIPLCLVIKMPVSIAEELDPHLKRIRIALRNTTGFIVEGRHVARLSEIEMSTIKMNLRITPCPRDSIFELDPSWWQSSTIPHITPESSTKIVEQHFWLQILCEFHSDTTSLSTVCIYLGSFAFDSFSPPPPK